MNKRIIIYLVSFFIILILGCGGGVIDPDAVSVYRTLWETDSVEAGIFVTGQGWKTREDWPSGFSTPYFTWKSMIPRSEKIGKMWTVYYDSIANEQEGSDRWTYPISLPDSEGCLKFMIKAEYTDNENKDHTACSPDYDGGGINMPYAFLEGNYANKIVHTASRYMQVPYVMGIGRDEEGNEIKKGSDYGFWGLDCSGLAWHAGYKPGNNLCDYTNCEVLWNVFRKPELTKDDRQDGDLIFVDVDQNGFPDHVGIYVNEPDSNHIDEIIHATAADALPQWKYRSKYYRGKRVMREKWGDRNYWELRFFGIGRIGGSYENIAQDTQDGDGENNTYASLPSNPQEEHPLKENDNPLKVTPHKTVLVLGYGKGNYEVGIDTSDIPYSIYHFEVDIYGNIWIDDQLNGRIMRFSPDGKFTGFLPITPPGFAISPDGEHFYRLEAKVVYEDKKRAVRYFLSKYNKDGKRIKEKNMKEYPIFYKYDTYNCDGPQIDTAGNVHIFLGWDISTYKIDLIFTPNLELFKQIVLKDSVFIGSPHWSGYKRSNIFGKIIRFSNGVREITYKPKSIDDYKFLGCDRFGNLYIDYSFPYPRTIRPTIISKIVEISPEGKPIGEITIAHESFGETPWPYASPNGDIYVINTSRERLWIDLYSNKWFHKDRKEEK